MIDKAELITTEVAQRKNTYGVLVPLAGRDSNKQLISGGKHPDL